MSESYNLWGTQQPVAAPVAAPTVPDYGLMPAVGARAPTLGTGSVPGVTAPTGGSLFGGFLNQYNDSGQITQQGWGMPAIAAGQGLFNAYMGMQQYGLFKDQLKQAKREFNLNYDAQQRTTNAALEDRQRARVASNPGAYQSVGDYMNQNGIQGR